MQRKVSGSLPCTGTAGGTDRSPRGRTLTIDWKVRNGLMRGRFELDFLDVPGRDLSGIVVGTGSNAPEFAVGDEVFGVCPPTRWGSRAELAAVYAGVLLEKPASIPHVEAASISLAGHTALTALDGAVEEGMQVLVHAVAGGVGAFAVQYCKSRRATVHATASARNAEGRWAPMRSTQPRISATRFRISTSSRLAATFSCARKARSNPASRWSASMPRPFPTAPGARTFAFRRRRSLTNARERSVSRRCSRKARCARRSAQRSRWTAPSKPIV